MQHHLLKLTWKDRLTTADVAKQDGVHRVLDVGTGTGIWAIEYGKAIFIDRGELNVLTLCIADEHPESIVSECSTVGPNGRHAELIAIGSRSRPQPGSTISVSASHLAG